MKKNTLYYAGGIHQHAFTILELMITAGIIAILMMVAIPSYQTAMAKSDRSIAISDINDIALAQSRFFSTNRSYATVFSDLNMASTTATLTDSEGAYNYTLATTNGNANYTVTATPITAKNRDKWLLRLTDAGVRTKRALTGTTWENNWP